MNKFNSIRMIILISGLSVSMPTGIAQTTPFTLELMDYMSPILPQGGPVAVMLLKSLYPQQQSDENLAINKIPRTPQKIQRPKRIGSLSIVNPFDVLRQRVLLELARRKQQQDQRQIDANRRFLQSIGKRSIPDNVYGPENEINEKREEENERSNRIPKKTEEWIEENDPVYQDEQAHRAMDNGFRLL